MRVLNPHQTLLVSGGFMTLMDMLKLIDKTIKIEISKFVATQIWNGIVYLGNQTYDQASAYYYGNDTKPLTEPSSTA